MRKYGESILRRAIDRGSRVLRGVYSAFSPRRHDDDLDEEIRGHIEMAAEEYVAQGMSAEDAARAARRDFGGVDQVKERHREARRFSAVDRISADLRITVRQLARSPGFAIVAVAVLALGIGAAVAIFTVIDQVVLHPLDYAESDRLVYIAVDMPGEGTDTNWGLSEAGYFHVRDRNRTLEAVGAYGGAEAGHQMTIVGSGGGVRVDAAYVSAALLDVLGARPAAGRLIGEEDDGWMEDPGFLEVVVLGYDFWLREYGGDPGVVGSTLRLEGDLALEIVGVMERGFEMPQSRVDIWLPLGLHPARTPDSFHGYRVVARLAPGATLDDAATDLARLDAVLPEAIPQVYSNDFMESSGFRTVVSPLRQRILGGLDEVLWILFGSVALVVLIALSNVASLFLVRAETQRRDRAIRTALGSGRLGLARQALMEPVLLSLVAAGAGVFLAIGALRVLLAAVPSGLPQLEDMAIGAPGVAAAFVLALVAGTALGCVLYTTLPSGTTLLRSGRGQTSSRSSHRLRRSMVATQMALALVLVAGAGVMLRSFERLRDVDPGIDRSGVIVADLHPPATRVYLQEPLVQPFYRDVVTRVSALPGVVRASAGGVPLAMEEPVCLEAYVEDDPRGPGQVAPCINQSVVAPGFFAAMGIPLRGREPGWADTDRDIEPWAGGEVVVTPALADRLWPGEDPIGKGIRLREPGPPYARVVGVTGDLYGDGLDRPPSEYIFGQLWYRANTLVVKAEAGAAGAVAAALRSAVREIDPSVAMGPVRTMEEVIATSPVVARTSLTLLLLGVGAATGLVLSAVGLFGLLAYVVGERRGEIGIRIALGASARKVAAMTVGDSLMLASVGALLGILAAIPATGLLRSLLFEVNPADPVALGAAALVLILVAMLASWLPARRAAHVDPMVVLREE